MYGHIVEQQNFILFSNQEHLPKRLHISPWDRGWVTLLNTFLSVDRLRWTVVGGGGLTHSSSQEMMAKMGVPPGYVATCSLSRPHNFSAAPTKDKTGI